MDGIGEDRHKKCSTGRIGGRQEVPKEFQVDQKYLKNLRRTRSTERSGGRQEVPEELEKNKNWWKTRIPELEGFKESNKYWKDFRKTRNSGRIS